MDDNNKTCRKCDQTQQTFSSLPPPRLEQLFTCRQNKTESMEVMVFVREMMRKHSMDGFHASQLLDSMVAEYHSTRSQTIQICQKLLDVGLLQCIGNPNEQFTDSCTDLYRFVLDEEQTAKVSLKMENQSLLKDEAMENSFVVSTHTSNNSVALNVEVAELVNTCGGSMVLKKEAINRLRLQVLRAADSTCPDWLHLKDFTCKTTNRTVKAFYRNSGGKFKTFLTTGRMNSSAEAFTRNYLDFDRRKRMDPCLRTGRVIEDVLGPTVFPYERDRCLSFAKKRNFHEGFNSHSNPFVEQQFEKIDCVKGSYDINDPDSQAASFFTSFTPAYCQAVDGGSLGSGCCQADEDDDVCSSSNCTSVNSSKCLSDSSISSVDSKCAQFSSVKQGNEVGCTRVIYSTMHGALMQSRDFVTLQDHFVLSNGTHVLYEISVQHRDIPNAIEGFTRGEVLCLAYIMEPIENVIGQSSSKCGQYMPSFCNLTLITQLGLNGKLPKWLTSFFSSKIMAKSFQDHPCEKSLPPDTSSDKKEKVECNVEDCEATKTKINDFELLGVLGRGGFAKVLQVRHLGTGKFYAMKVVQKKGLLLDSQIEHTQNERSILAAIEHPFIVGLEYAFQTEKRLYMVMDFVQGGDLSTHIQKYGKIEESRVKIYAAEIALALHHLHQLDIAYRDLKPENILIDNEGHLKVADFGLSHLFDDDCESSSDGEEVNRLTYQAPCLLTHSFCGTEAYMAPEMLLQTGHGKSVDWWCLGIVVHEMLTEKNPFCRNKKNRNHFFNAVLHDDPILSPELSASAASLISGLLKKNPLERMRFQSLQQHPFFSDMQWWNQVFNKEIKMSFRPVVKDERDLSHFEPFSQTGSWAYCSESENDRPVYDSDFPNFSYEATISADSNIN